MRHLAMLCSGLAAVSLTACQEETYRGPVDLDGRWGWGSSTNCEDDTSVWVFNQQLWEIRRRGVMVERREFTFTRDVDSNIITLEYFDEGKETTRRLRVEDNGDQIRLKGGTVDGATDPAIEFQINNYWVRCPNSR